MKFVKHVAILLSAAILMAGLTACSSSEEAYTDSPSAEAIEINFSESGDEATNDVSSDWKVDLGQFYEMNMTKLSYKENSYVDDYSMITIGDFICFTETVFTYNDVDLTEVFDETLDSSMSDWSANSVIHVVNYVTKESCEYEINLAIESAYEYGDNVYFSFLEAGNYSRYVISKDKLTSLDFDESDFTRISAVAPDECAFTEEGYLTFGSGVLIISKCYHSEGLLVAGFSNDEDKLWFISNEGIITDLSGDLDQIYVWDMFSYDETSIGIVDSDNNSYILNISDFSIEKCDGEFKYFFDNKVFSSEELSGYYSNSLEALTYVEPQTMFVEKVIDYNAVVGDTRVLSDSVFLAKDDDGTIYMFGFGFDEGFGKWIPCIFTLNPIENPYSDRTLIRMACASLNEYIVLNIKNYNNLNDEYYIEYRLIDGSVPNLNVSSHTGAYSHTFFGGSATDFYRFLAEGADVESMEYSILKDGGFDLLYGFDDALFLSENISMDLTNEIDTTYLYTNVIDASKVDGHIYQIPLTFAVNSVVYNTDLDYGDIPNTYVPICDVQPYNRVEDFVALNEIYGFDPLHMYISDYECLIELLNANLDSYVSVSDDKVNLTGFDEIIDFSMINTTDSSNVLLQNSELSTIVKYEEFSNLDYESIFTLLDFTVYWNDYNTRFYYGVPSSTSDGLPAVATNSIGVYVDTDNQSGALDFVNYMISEDIISSFDCVEFQINTVVNERVQNNVFEYVYYPGETEFEYLHDYFKLMNEFISHIQGFTYTDRIIDSVVLKTLVDMIGTDTDITSDEAINAFESSIQSVLDRY